MFIATLPHAFFQVTNCWNGPFYQGSSPRTLVTLECAVGQAAGQGMALMVGGKDEVIWNDWTWQSWLVIFQSRLREVFKSELYGFQWKQITLTFNASYWCWISSLVIEHCIDLLSIVLLEEASAGWTPSERGNCWSLSQMMYVFATAPCHQMSVTTTVDYDFFGLIQMCCWHKRRCTWPLAALTSLDIPRTLLSPKRRLQQEGTQRKKWSMNQHNWRRKNRPKKQKKLGDDSLSKIGWSTVHAVFTSISK